MAKVNEYLFVWALSSHSRIFHSCGRHHYRWRAANFDLCSVLMAIEQWGFFRVPHLLWHSASVYNGHLRGPVTLAPIAELLAMELSLPVFTSTTKVCRGWDSNSKPSTCGANALIHRATAAVEWILNWCKFYSHLKLPHPPVCEQNSASQAWFFIKTMDNRKLY